MEPNPLYLRILSFLYDQHARNPLVYVGCSILRATFNTPVYALRPYIETLELNGYLEKKEGLSPTYLVRITKKGVAAVHARSVSLERTCLVDSRVKLSVLSYLHSRYLLNEDTYYVPHQRICKALGIDEERARIIADELSYMGLARILSVSPPSFTLQITPKGMSYLAENAGALASG